MPVPACWVARALFRNALSPAASSPVTTVRQVSTGQPGWRKSRWKSPISALPRQPGHTSGKVTADSTRTAVSPGPPLRPPSGWWKVRPVGATVSARPGAAHCSCSGSRGAQRRAGRSVPPSRCPRHIGRGELRRKRQQPVRLQPAGLRPGRSERAFERPAEGAERGLRGRAGTACQAGGDEHPVVGEGEGRPAGVQAAPATGREQIPAPGAHARQRPSRARTRTGPAPRRRAEARTRPVDELHGAAFGRGVGQRARKRSKGLGVDARERRELDDEAGRVRVDVELARLVEGAPGQQRVERRRHRGRRPGARAPPAPRTAPAGGGSFDPPAGRLQHDPDMGRLAVDAVGIDEGRDPYAGHDLPGAQIVGARDRPAQARLAPWAVRPEGRRLPIRRAGTSSSRASAAAPPLPPPGPRCPRAMHPSRQGEPCRRRHRRRRTAA